MAASPATIEKITRKTEKRENPAGADTSSCFWSEPSCGVVLLVEGRGSSGSVSGSFSKGSEVSGVVSSFGDSDGGCGSFV